ncbi:MAG: HEAT repeat domain-containing protein [Gammaproteobacteria bacterium]|nr:HEAT repeat domain-containing protein [Gammaproteobacteria bacterium]
MWHKKGLWCMAMLWTCFAFADDVDVYGADDELASEIIQKYGDKVLHLEKELIYARMHHLQVRSLLQRQLLLQQRIQSRYRIKRVNFETVYYPTTQTTYTTIQVLDHDFPRGDNYPRYQAKSGHDVVDDMILFTEKIPQLYLKNPQFADNPVCKDFQCIVPDDPIVENDLENFRKKVSQNPQFIIQTIEKDPILDRRRAAIFLLAYFKDPQEIARVLNQTLKDKNYYIRHDTLRVFGELYAKAPDITFDIQSVLQSLKADHVAERNKALIFVNEMVSKQKYHQEVKQHAALQLVKLLKLKQPNNHDLAYEILVKISHHPYPSDAILVWEAWANKVIKDPI